MAETLEQGLFGGRRFSCLLGHRFVVSLVATSLGQSGFASCRLFAFGIELALQLLFHLLRFFGLVLGFAQARHLIL
jgi:hypothetical protein